MLFTRFSTQDDVPVLRRLWKLAFGDSDAYLDNFFLRYYRPERVFVLEEEGEVLSMSAWFDTRLALPDGPSFRAAYLYAVATHPDQRGRGLAAKLMADLGRTLSGMGVQLLTTVPAEPSLHDFFARNDFSEYFTHSEFLLLPKQEVQALPGVSLRPASPEEYGRVREELLAKLPHIAYSRDALDYQAGCCALSGGGLYIGDTAQGPVCLCAEGMGEGQMVAKELLGAADVAQAGCLLFALNARVIWRLRTPEAPACPGSEREFGMLRWLGSAPYSPSLPGKTGYLGLAFD